MRWIIPSVVALFLACSGDADPPSVDADTSGFPLCTNATFDPCTDNAQCTSDQCQVFDQLGITVCTQSCDVNTPCPMQNGQQTSCNNKGLCRPIAANSCRR